MTVKQLTQIERYVGPSTATKPLDCSVGSTFLEEDTSRLFVFDGTGWFPKTQDIVIYDAEGNPLEIEDGRMKVSVDASVVAPEEVVWSNITLRDGQNPSNKLAVLPDGSLKVQLSGTAVTGEVLLDAVSVAPLTQTNQINLNITNEKKVVLLVWNDLNTLQIRSSAPWWHIPNIAPDWGCLYPPPSNFSAAPFYDPHVFVWVGMHHPRLGLTDIKEAFDIALPPASPSFIQVWNNDPDETLTITIHILRYWR